MSPTTPSASITPTQSDGSIPALQIWVKNLYEVDRVGNTVPGSTVDTLSLQFTRAQAITDTSTVWIYTSTLPNSASLNVTVSSNI